MKKVNGMKGTENKTINTTKAILEIYDGVILGILCLVLALVSKKRILQSWEKFKKDHKNDQGL